MAYLDIFAGQVEQGQSLLQVVGEKRDTKQIGELSLNLGDGRGQAAAA
jgi:hypothetical protein